LKRLLTLALLLTLCAAGPARAIEALEARNRAFKLLTEGMRAYEAGRYAEAVEKLEEVTGISLNSFQGYYYLGLAYHRLRRYDDAIDSLQVALELEPGHLQSRVARGNAFLMSGALREASVEYHKALELQGEYAPGFDGLGRHAEARGREAEAEELYRRAIKLNPGFPDSYLHLGDLLLRQGQVDRAVDLFLKAIEVRPDFARAYNRLGTAYAQQRLFDEAMAAIGRARELRPLDAAHPLALGKVLFELDLWGRAEQEYQEAIRLDPDLLEAYLRLAERYRAERRFAEALDVLEQGNLRPVEDPLMRREIDEARQRYAGERERLEALELRAASGAELSLDEALLLARVYADVGDHTAAADLLGPYLEKGPVEMAVQFELGYYQLESGRFAEAEKVFAYLTEIDPRDTAALVNLGIAHAALGRLGEAAEAYERALKIDARLTEALLYLGNVHVRLGNPEKAVESYRQFLQVQEGGDHVERVRRILEMLEEGAG
jgi:tetratricopeptide (TPR) repeat protein